MPNIWSPHFTNADFIYSKGYLGSIFAHIFLKNFVFDALISAARYDDKYYVGNRKVYIVSIVFIC